MSTYIKTPLVIVRHNFRERLVVPCVFAIPIDNKFSTKFEMHKYKDRGVVFQKHTSAVQIFSLLKSTTLVRIAY